MILRQVREDEHGEPRPLEPALRAGLRGRLEHAGAVAGVGHLAQEPLEVDRLGRVEAGRALLAADAPLDVRQQARLAACGLEDRAQQERGGRLPVRAGDRRDVELGATGSPKKSTAATGIAARTSVDDELRQVDRRPDARRRAPPRPSAAAVGANACPSALRPRTQKKSAPGVTVRVS